jgi:tRNA A-37 threonylcarbamoyl transferase component Bud32
MMPEHGDAIDYDAHRSFFRDVLQAIHDIMAEHHGLSNVSIKPLGAGGSRLSIPVKIEGTDKNGNRVKLFAKILGNSELMTNRTIQLFKNIFLHSISKQPMFDFNADAEEMAKHQYNLLHQIHDMDIPTAKPLGYYRLKGNLWLLVEEYLEAKPISAVSEITEDYLDTAFSYLAKMHKKGIFHGDIKPDNIMFADKVYIMDVGNFLDSAPEDEKKAYDLACSIASFLDYAPPENIVALALKHFSKKDVKHAVEYIELIQRRPDINFTDEVKQVLVGQMLDPGKKRKE